MRNQSSAPEEEEGRVRRGWYAYPPLPFGEKFSANFPAEFSGKVCAKFPAKFSGKMFPLNLAGKVPVDVT